MKKSIIAAGAASVVLAAMPMFGVFATNTMNVTDNLSVTVSESCTLATEDGTSTAVTGNSYSGSGAPGGLVTLGTGTGVDPTTVRVQCNAVGGYTITPTFSSLVNGSHSITYGSGNTEAAGGSGTWTAYYSKNSGAATAFTTSAVPGSSTMTDTYTFSYKVGLSNDQATGTYTGTAQYALAAAS